jgi:hypothetical protein
MGISDKDYANALEHQRVHAQALRSEGAVSTTPSGSKVLLKADLNSEAMKAPLSALVDMWTMRWQGEWVSEDAFQGDDFWRLALIRLVGANKLEKHNLASQYASVYRIID